MSDINALQTDLLRGQDKPQAKATPQQLDPTPKKSPFFDKGPLKPRQMAGWVLIACLVLFALGRGFMALQSALQSDPPHIYDPAKLSEQWWLLGTIGVATALVTAALSFYVSTPSDKINRWWRLFWTAAFIAYVTHVAVAMIGKSWNIDAFLQLPWNKILGLVLIPWWGIDVLLAWLAPKAQEHQLPRFCRSFLHFVVMGFFVAAGTKSAVSGALALGLGLSVGGAALYHLIRHEEDKKSLTRWLLIGFFYLLNRFVPWHKLPTPFAVLNLIVERERLRDTRLFSTAQIPVSSAERGFDPASSKVYVERQTDGRFNDPKVAEMGCASLKLVDPEKSGQSAESHRYARFGRNVPLESAYPEAEFVKAGEGKIPGPLLTPSPREVSNRLLGRPERDGKTDVKRVEQLNLLAAAWIQFQTHDWFSHGTPLPLDETRESGKPFEIGLKGEEWPGAVNGCMPIRRTRPDPTRDLEKERDGNDGRLKNPPTFVSAETHWWDGSQIYGSDMKAPNTKPSEKNEKTSNRFRSYVDGKLRIDPTTYRLPIEDGPMPASWWLGLGLLHVLFTLEHNAICDHLLSAFPHWREREDRDEHVFRVARLVNCALMAKIHTIDWTCAILDNPALTFLMRGAWWGAAQETITRYLGRLGESEIASGIPGSKQDHFGEDFCMTEEFASVYRLHPLLPEDLPLRNHADGSVGRTLIFRPKDEDRLAPEVKFNVDAENDPDLITGPHAMAHGTMDGAEMTDAIYTFGVEQACELTLRNYPNWMRKIRRRDSKGEREETIDLAAIDILRDRERGVPRYNEFRKQFGLRTLTMEEIAHGMKVKAKIKALENGKNKLEAELEAEQEKSEILRALNEVYGGDPDKVDLMVGMFAENPPPGFGFSDTAFRVFVLMASRRLKSDRFFTDYYRPEIYTQPGLDWVNANTMKTVILRHFPELTAALRDVENAFEPWDRVKAH